MPGTFFILPNLVKSNTALVKRMHEEGHLVGNHSYSHKNMSNMPFEAFEKEITDLEALYAEYTGYTMSKLFRPPEGAFTEQTLQTRAAGLTAVFWSFAYADWDNNKQPDPQAAKEKILSNVHNGMVMLLHPTSATNAAILEDASSSRSRTRATASDAWTSCAYRRRPQRNWTIIRKRAWSFPRTRTAARSSR